MHKPVRYYITESNDQPLVRSVQISARVTPDEDLIQATGQAADPAPPVTRRISRSSITRKLKQGRSTDASA